MFRTFHQAFLVDITFQIVLYKNLPTWKDFVINGNRLPTLFSTNQNFIRSVLPPTSFPPIKQFLSPISLKVGDILFINDKTQNFEKYERLVHFSF